MINLRSYQQDAVNRAREEYRQGKHSVCLVLPCRAGKTVIAAYMAKKNTDRHKRVLFLVHRIELCEQTEETFRKLGVDMDYCDVGMVQTLTNRTADMPYYDFIITDEGHHSLCKTYKKIYESMPKTSKIFLTATPTRLDGKGLGNICDSLVVGVTPNWLLENHYLAPYDYYAPTLVDFSDCKKRCGDFEKKEVSNRMMSEKKIYGDVIKHYNRLCKGKKAIAYCASVEHSKEVCKIFNDNGISAAHVDGKTPKTKREEIMNGFRTGKYMVLCNFSIISEGLDISDCEACLLLRPTDSLCLYIQMACRCLTYKDGKRAIILDFVGNVERHGMPTDDREWSLKDGVKKVKQTNDDGTLKIRVCQNCFGTFETAPVCPYCGAEYSMPRKEIETVQEAKLEKVNAIVAKRKENYKKRAQRDMEHVNNIYDCNTLFEMVQWCKVHGKKNGYAYVIAKRKGLM